MRTNTHQPSAPRERNSGRWRQTGLILVTVPRAGARFIRRRDDEIRSALHGRGPDVVDRLTGWRATASRRQSVRGAVRYCGERREHRRSATNDFRFSTSSREVLAGLVERVTLHNEENGFCVLRTKARGQRELVTVVGQAASISAGEWITASGEWINDRTHGLRSCPDRWCSSTGASRSRSALSIAL